MLHWWRQTLPYLHSDSCNKSLIYCTIIFAANINDDYHFIFNDNSLISIKVSVIIYYLYCYFNFPSDIKHTILIIVANNETYNWSTHQDIWNEVSTTEVYRGNNFMMILRYFGQKSVVSRTYRTLRAFRTYMIGLDGGRRWQIEISF